MRWILISARSSLESMVWSRLLVLLVILLSWNPEALNSIARRLNFISIGNYEESFQSEVSARDWPSGSGIRLINNISPAGTVKIPKLYHQLNTSSVQIKRQQSRTFVWHGDELTILFNMTSLQSPLCTRLTPPLSWISASGCKVRVLHRGLKTSSSLMDIIVCPEDVSNQEVCQSSEPTSTIEIVAPRKVVEATLSTLRMMGFQREDLFRILDKGPWILAMDVRSVVSRLFGDLQVVCLALSRLSLHQ